MLAPTCSAGVILRPDEARGVDVHAEVDNRLKFPVPFGGVEYYVQATDQRQLDEFVLRLMACDHQHHFAVSDQGVWVSANTLDWGCLDGKEEPRFDRKLAEAMAKATAYDTVTHEEVPCTVVWNEPCRRVEVEFEASCDIKQGVHWIDDDGVGVFTWDVQQLALCRGDIISFSVEFE